MGFFAGPVLESDSRWLSGSIYVFVLNPATEVVEFSGGPSSFAVSERIVEVLFDGRDLLDVVATFGEAFAYYSFTNPATGETEGKVMFSKRVVAQGVPLLVGSGIYTAGPVVGSE